ncbi:MAG: RNA methyltransferase [Tissierellia bacterium]|nr:RNA methyltransferase [Tissierellia bacterium]
MIESDSNKFFKNLKKLQQKKYRQKTQTFLIESKKLVEEAIKSNSKIIDIIVNEDYIKNHKLYDYKTVILKNELFSKLSNLNNPEGIMARVKIVDRNLEFNDKILILDNINDPGNMGTIIRSAEAFGFYDIILTNDCVDIYNYKSLRASMGSVFRVNVVVKDINYIKKLRKDYVILASSMDGIDYRQINDKKLALIIGNEANGISDELFEISDKKIKIPMRGENESLNAAIAASILMNGLNQ